jgi:hypothetical protein
MALYLEMCSLSDSEYDYNYESWFIWYLL